ncbi:hypothetical protein [Formivibrio citricus]|uniref:hypothetical protein n=1 Tax=Formivibrio citricus TaxID=83765 RepID=UPI0011608510|nr:hypothetical protein [Formivibrio citricus]
MRKYIYRVFAAAILMHSTHASSAANEDLFGKHLTCAGYYLTLSLLSPDFVHDYSEKEAGKVYFKHRLIIENIGSEKNIPNLVHEKFFELQSSIPRPITKEGVSEFRAKFDTKCKTL